MTGEAVLTLRQKRILEVIAAFGLYLVVFDATVGPLIDATLPGDQPSMFRAADGLNIPYASDFPDTIRGLLGVGTLVPFILLYIYYRPRLTGQSPVEYWKPVDPDRIESRRNDE